MTMRVLIATDAWHPQINGVLRSLEMMEREAPALGAKFDFLTPDQFPSVPLPNYPEIRLALASKGAVARHLDALGPQFVHVATEGPIGWRARAWCRARGVAFTTCFHTRLPDYIATRMPVPRALIWAVLRRFHAAGSGVMVSTATLDEELGRWGFPRRLHWPPGVDAELFRPRPGADLGLPRPVFLAVARLAKEKNLDAFLALDLPGTKVVVGDGPARPGLVRRFPDTVFLGAKQGEELAAIYSAADVFVFPSRTDTFGLVMLEALASGVPVAAFPVAGPRDVIVDPAVGVLDEDLRAACLKALELSRPAARAFAMRRTWRESTRVFLDHVAAETDRTPRPSLQMSEAADCFMAHRG